MVWSMSRGIDISHHQGRYLNAAHTAWVSNITDYARARAAVDWVQIKISEGTGFIDPGAAIHYHGFGGKPRGAYHFARAGVDVQRQMRLFMSRKGDIGPWERLDMLDIESPGTGTADFMRRVIDEYRAASGQAQVLVYGSVSPTGWVDNNIWLWRPRYRHIGPPKGPDDWANHLGWDHPRLAIYQWDDKWPLPGGGLVDIDSQRLALVGEDDDMSLVEFYGARDNQGRNWLDFQNWAYDQLNGIAAAVIQLQQQQGSVVDSATLTASLEPLIGPALAHALEEHGQVDLDPEVVGELSEAVVRKLGERITAGALLPEEQVQQ